MDSEQLKTALDALVKDPSLAPANGKTFCNIAALRICALFGVPDFAIGASGDPPLADAMCDILAASKNFRLADIQQANLAAFGGNLVIAAHKYQTHGHVAVVYPSRDMYYSASWKKEVPFVCNIGKDDGILPASKVFPVAKGEPSYFIYEPAVIA